MTQKRNFFKRLVTRCTHLFQSINWKYALGEIFLLFVGINLAIAFNNWNTNRIKVKIEWETLKELKEGIQKDHKDIETNIFGHKGRQQLYRYLTDHIEHKRPVSDTLLAFLPYLMGTTTFVTNTAPYEMLKARGLDVISNDSIRLKLLTYYDISQEWIVDNEILHREHFKNYLKPFALKYVRLKEGGYYFADYEAMLTDTSISPIFYWAIRTDSYILQLYKNALQETETLNQLLETEIERLSTKL